MRVLIIIALLGGLIFYHGKIKDLEAEVEDHEYARAQLHRKIDTVKQQVSDIEGQIIQFDYDMDRFGFDNWRDVVPDVSSDYEDLKAQIEGIKSTLD